MTDRSTASGGCLCGAIRFVAEGEPYRVGLCHCLDCRKQSGAPFGAFVIFPADKVAFSGDEPGVFAGRRFCRSCGSPVYGRAEGSDEVELHLGSFDKTGLFAPTYELWTIRREPWLPAIARIERHYERDRPHGRRSEP